MRTPDACRWQVGAGDSKELNYEEMDEEHRKLLAVIRESQSSACAPHWLLACGPGLTASAGSRMEPRDRMLLRAQVPLRVETVAAEEEGEDAGVEAVPAEVRHHLARGPGGMLLRVSVRLFVSYTGGCVRAACAPVCATCAPVTESRGCALSRPRSDPVEDVHLSLHVPPAIHVRETSMVLPSVGTSTARLPRWRGRLTDAALRAFASWRRAHAAHCASGVLARDERGVPQLAARDRGGHVCDAQRRAAHGADRV